MTLEMLRSTPSIGHWKLAGQPSNLIGDMIHWNWSWHGIAKAMSCCDFLSNCICQKPDVRSKVEKMVEFACPMSPMHSVISFIEYLSKSKWLLSSQNSCTTQSPSPWFLGTQKIGELYSELAHLTTLSWSHSSRDCSMKNWWASDIFICFLITGSFFWGEFYVHSL